MFNKIGFGGHSGSQPKKQGSHQSNPQNGNNRENKQQSQQSHKSQKPNENKNSLLSMLQKREHPDKQTASNLGHKLTVSGQKPQQPNQKQEQPQQQQKQPQQGVSKKAQKVKDKEADLQNRIEEGLVGSKFRMMNEYFYTTDSKTSADHFSKNKNDFLLYHKGFQSQIQKWPDKPVDMIIKEIDTQKYSNAIVADLGCGDGKIYEFFRDNNKLKSRGASQGVNDIHSFDLCSHKDFIKVADSKSIPLADGSCDIVVFCLALMGTNYVDFLLEARRLLRKNGSLIISEVNSRIPNMDLFIELIVQLGFTLQKKVLPNSYFCLITLKKTSEPKILGKSGVGKFPVEFAEKFLKAFPSDDCSSVFQVSQVLLKPCIYKKR